MNKKTIADISQTLADKPPVSQFTNIIPITGKISLPESIRLYNPAAELFQQRKFAEADKIFQDNQFRVPEEFKLAWDLSLLKNKMDNFWSHQAWAGSVFIQDAPIENAFFKYAAELQKYFATPEDNFYGLLACRLDTGGYGLSLRYFIGGLPGLSVLPENMKDALYDVPIVRECYSSIIKNDLENYRWDRAGLLSFYEGNNQYLYYFLKNLYQG